MDSYRYRRKGSLSIQQVLYLWESDREREKKKRRFHIVIFFFFLIKNKSDLIYFLKIMSFSNWVFLFMILIIVNL
jgi:hypothetical protein